MDFLALLQAYTLVSLALAGTSYFVLYRPAIALAEEILDEDLKLHKGWLGVSIWLILTTIFSPLTLYELVRNNNKGFIYSLALHIAETEDE